MQKQQTRVSAITHSPPGEAVAPEVQTIVNVCRPLEAQGYAPVPAQQQGDRLPLYIGLAFLAALVVMAGIHFSDGEKQKLKDGKAKSEAKIELAKKCMELVSQ